ncbi:hypothetical protein [Piscinibacter gummiphilus]|uniref:Uncharacterized protein n=1 Tax=Piscinibacter gummiphilus TaxID=946333 RepID=A0A1W6LGN5_9BURK|nr:hypothetical protein [Piscinibacter gummiphilus]ARN23444.1 hypothetical protein A4W93_28070 [Piscinibacter gummiphilus]ATU68151.1 hypothetical protein CPZ87_28205 [Piscinibacter gummiphilus]GLS97466.1 hypothetical protein GCM10007918_47580 [Piscinibacter gummiphilus]
MDPAGARRFSRGTPFRFPRWLLACVFALLIPAYTFAAVTDPRPLAAATADAEADDAAPSAVDLAGEHSDCSDDASDHVADTVPPQAVRPADPLRLTVPGTPPRARSLDTLLRPPSALR